MKHFLILVVLCLCIFAVASAQAQTYVTEEFVVEGDSTITEAYPSTQTTVVTTTSVPATVVTTTPSSVVVVPGERVIYTGMTGNHVREILGPPIGVQRFRKMRSRQYGIYDEIWTYGNTYVYIKDRRVIRVDY